MSVSSPHNNELLFNATPGAGKPLNIEAIWPLSNLNGKRVARNERMWPAGDFRCRVWRPHPVSGAAKFERRCRTLSFRLALLSFVSGRGAPEWRAAAPGFFVSAWAEAFAASVVAAPPQVQRLGNGPEPASVTGHWPDTKETACPAAPSVSPVPAPAAVKSLAYARIIEIDRR